MLTATILLASRMAIVALIVVSVSVVAARSGPVLGAMLATLPVSAGPTYVFLAMDHGPDFIARAAVVSILAACANAPFIVAYDRVSRIAGTVPSFLAAVGAFLVTIAAASFFPWTIGGAVVAGTLVMAAAIAATRSTRRSAAPFALPPRRIDLVIRAGSVMLVVGAVTILGQLAGPRAAGYAALMPVVFMSFVIVMQPRVGGRPVAGLFSHALFGILGFVPAFAAINLTTEPLGVWWALTLGLATSLAWNAAVLALRRWGLLRL